MTLFRDDLLRWQSLPVNLVHGGSLRRALSGPAAETVAGIAADPGLCLYLLEHLAALGLRSERATIHALVSSLEPQRLQAVLRALSLRKLLAAEAAAPCAAQREQALLRACVARAIARSIRYSEPEEAYLCALVLHAGEWMRSDSAGPSAPDQAQAEISQNLMQRWGMPLAAMDALRYRHLDWSQLAGAHTLTIVLRIADEIGSGRDEAALANQALAGLRDQAQIECRSLLQEDAGPPNADEVHAAFSLNAPMSADEAAAFIRHEFQAWFGAHPLLLFREEPASKALRGLAAPAAAEDLRLLPGSPVSIAVRAASEARLLSAVPARAPQQTLADEQMARILRRPGLLCVPMQGDAGNGVMVIGVEAREATALQARSAALLQFAHRAADLLRHTPPATAAPVAAPEPEPPAQRIREVLHEAAAPMTTLRNYLHVLRQRGSAGEELRIMADEVERLQGILRQLDPRQATAGTPGDDLNGLVRDVLYGFQVDPLFQSQRISSDLDPALRALPLDAGALKQILINLCRNALEALPPGGQVRVLTRDGINVDGCDSCLIEVGDNGPGIPAPLLTQLFEPKASSKPGHSGLGLSIVRRLVRELGGSISCQSGSSGTRFQILLPRSAAVFTESPEH